MYIENYIDPKPQRSLLYGEKSMGIVVKTPEELDKDNVVGVYIPRFMFGLPNGEGAYEKNVSYDTKLILNSKNKKIGSTSFKSKNFVVLPVAQTGCVMSSRLVKGENVFIECCDRDIKNLYALPFTLSEQVKRKDDIYTILVPNFKDWDESPTLNIDNTYGIQIDTRNKKLSMWTSCEGGGETGDNEKGKYFISINSKDGKILISDNGKRTWTLNTEEDSIVEQNEGGCKIEMVEGTINIYAPDEINIKTDKDNGGVMNIKSSELNREIDDIKTTAKTDKEDTDKFEISGDEFNSDYDKTNLKCKDFECKADSSWKTDSPVSGFTKILTSNEFSISSNAGKKPMPSAPTIDSNGKFKSADPNIPSLPAALYMPLDIVLNAIATKLDGVCSIVGMPPTSAAAVASFEATGKSKTLFG